ncbi:alanine dehydrogenase, partial [Escherichia coli]|nr:alanine dehydrogenase [Escherichia coli]
GVQALTQAGHTVFVQKTAGEGSGFSDDQYVKAGGKLLDTADDVWAEGDMIVKVKEPIEPEYPRMRENQLLFTYLHLAPEFELTKQMMERKVT